MYIYKPYEIIILKLFLFKYENKKKLKSCIHNII